MHKIAALDRRGRLTGDNEATARRIAAELGVGSVIAEVLPGQNAEKWPSCSGPGNGWLWSATG